MLLPVLTGDIADARREIEHTALRERAGDEARDVRLRISDGFEPARDTEPIEEARDRLIEVRADVRICDARDGRIRGRGVVENRERLAVPVGRRGRGEFEDCSGWVRRVSQVSAFTIG